MLERPNPFDKFGNVTGLPEDEIDKLDKVARADYFGMLAASVAERDAAQAVEDGRANLKAIVDKCRDLHATYDNTVPKPSPTDEHRRVLAAQQAARFNLPYESPKPDPKAEKLRKKIEAAEHEQAEARQLVDRLLADLKKKRDELSQAVVRWQNGAKVETHDMIRDHLRRLKDYEANGGEFVEAPNAGPASHLDAILGSRAGGHLAANRGFGNSVRRRGSMVPKLPSQR
jgi:hypothetical protein